MRELLRRLFKANPRFARRQYRRARRLSRHELGRGFSYSAYREIYAILRYLYLLLPFIFIPFAAWDFYALTHEPNPGLMIYFDMVFFPVVIIMLLLLHYRPRKYRGMSPRRLRIMCTLGVTILALAAVSANIILLESLPDLSIFSGGLLAIAIIFRFPDKTKYYIYAAAAIILYTFYFLKGITQPAMIQNPLFALCLALVLDRTAYLTLVNNYLKKRRILELNEILVREDRNKSDMMGIAIHDLKSPVAGIMSVTGMVKDNPHAFSDREKSEILGDIESSSRKILDRIEKLVSLASASIGAMEMKIQSLELHSFVYAVMESWNYQASSKRIRIRLRLNSNLPRVRADADALTRILDNLVSNAVKFSPPGGLIRIHAHYSHAPAAHAHEPAKQTGASGPSVMLIVRDGGPGFSEGDRPRMFSRMARLSARPTAGESSSGMGLYITRKLAGALDARIEARDPAGGGARFVLALPAEAPGSNRGQ